MERTLSLSSVNRGVILAAGDGDRMGELTKACPKVLLPINDSGEPLITSPIRALVESGVRDIAIVVGHLGYQIKRYLGDGSRYGVKLDYLENEDYLGGNGISAWKAGSWAEGKPVILCMGDHIIDPGIVWHLIKNNSFTDTLCVEYRPLLINDIEEATKVALYENGCISDIGKELINWDAIDTGVFLLTEKFFKSVEELIQSRGKTIEISEVIRYMIAKGLDFSTCNVSGYSWMDIDIEDDLLVLQTKKVLDGHRL